MRRWWWRLAGYARPFAGSLSVLIVLSFVGVGFEAIKPWPLKLIVDSVLPGKPLPGAATWLLRLPGAASSRGLLGWLAFSTIVSFLLAWLNRVLNSYVLAGTGSRMIYHLAADVFEHLQRLSLAFHGRRSAGDLVKRVTTDCGCIRELVIDVCMPFVTSIFSVILMFGIMWRLDRSLALLTLVVLPPLGLLIRAFSGPMADRSYQESELQGEMMAVAEQTLTALPIIQAFGREEAESKRFSALTNRIGKAYLGVVETGLKFKIGIGSITATATAIIMGLGGLHVLRGQVQVGDLLVFLSYLGSLYAPLETLAYLYMSFASASAGGRRVLEILQSDEQVREMPDAHALPATPPGHGARVILENLSFSYAADSAALQDVSLDVQPGETVALVGPTGAGKTTLVSLILRLHDPSEGRVTYDGHDLRQLKLSSLRAKIAIVLQDPFLLPMSIAENIAYGRPEASREEIVAAARAANAEEFVLRLPKGYDTVIGERGATLSGGERQRIAIARAFLKDAPVLILDEPTSALDTQTESLIIGAMRALMHGRTTFIIGHRLSTVSIANRIAVLQEGRIVESGTHEDLLARKGLFYQLHSLQFGETVGAGQSE